MVFSGASRQLSLDIEEEVFRHLIFHKALIDDDSEDMYGRLEKYMEILSDLKEGVHITIKDSYSRSIAMILELATESYLDPWDVDLVMFCKMFLGKLRKQERFNLMVIGKLIKMAYTVHYMKSSDKHLKILNLIYRKKMFASRSRTCYPKVVSGRVS